MKHQSGYYREYGCQAYLAWRRMLWVLILLFAFLFFPASPFIGSLSADPIREMLHRILPENGDAKKFTWKRTGGDTQTFTIACNGKRVSVEGSDYIAIATGINWYLQHYVGIDISWNSPIGILPETLPVCAAETHTSSVPLRYYLNFCTYSYSMAFWDWDRWQQELDWMALHGVNMPLAIVGMECVWKEVLMHDYGYRTFADVNDFVSGSAYYGWFFMNNLTGWGGPQPESWYTLHQKLARKIFQSMSDWGMQPVVPGYVGMIPHDFLTRAEASKVATWKATDIVDGGRWCSFIRPAFVNNTQRLEEFASRYYGAFQRLYGDVCRPHHWAIDPFHEGGVPAGVTDAQSSVAVMWKALQSYDNEAIWVAQHWQDNPTPILTHNIPRGRLIILDLHGDQYADVACSGHHTTAEGAPHEWIWGQVSNFGGNVGLFGRMDRLIHCYYHAREEKATNGLVGIGALPEGIENNSMLYDLLYALPWTTTDYTRESWLADYVKMRYGVESSADEKTYKTLLGIWMRLGESVYNCPNDLQQGTTESVFLMRPSLKAGTVSSWANSTWYWDFHVLQEALGQMLAVRDAFPASQQTTGAVNYRYDLVDLTRQVLADSAKTILDRIAMTSGEERRVLADRFLQLLLLQDRLLGTQPMFRLGRWTEMARRWGQTDEEKALYEYNARMLLTTWGDKPQCEAGGLHDYANREWQGLLASYYYPRWKAFFDNDCQPLPWFVSFEWPFVHGERGPAEAYLPFDSAYTYGTFSPEAEGDALQLVEEIYQLLVPSLSN